VVVQAGRCPPACECGGLVTPPLVLRKARIYRPEGDGQLPRADWRGNSTLAYVGSPLPVSPLVLSRTGFHRRRPPMVLWVVARLPRDRSRSPEPWCGTSAG